jgi:hypothetical protein
MQRLLTDGQVVAATPRRPFPPTTTQE